MKQDKCVTLWDVLYIIPYHSHGGTPIVEEIYDELKRYHKFSLNEEEYELFSELCEELNKLIQGIYEKYDGELSGMNGAEDTDMICEELKLNPKKPMININSFRMGKVSMLLYSK